MRGTGADYPVVVMKSLYWRWSEGGNMSKVTNGSTRNGRNLRVMQTSQLWGDMRSWMSREAHVWICEGLGGGSPGLLDWGPGEKNPRLPD